jgi:class 3 adenylate cyclase
VKYIFIDIVDFTKDRSVEDQSDIIMNMNKIVDDTILACSIDREQLIVLPTGDGLCISLIDLRPYDIHLLIAICILELLHTYNLEQKDEKRRFQFRVGINENVDNLITDFNGRRSVAGAGINMAQRIMDKADGNQILVSQTVHETLRHRDKYMNSFQPFTAKGKHDQIFNVYQYINPENMGLNNEKPSIFTPPTPPQLVPPRLPRQVAYYLAHAIANRDFFISKINDTVIVYAGIILLYFLSCDSTEISQATPYKPPRVITRSPGSGTIEEQFNYYEKLDFWVICCFSEEITEKYLSKFDNYFEGPSYNANYIFPNDNGRAKLKKDWPDIWEDFFGA